MAPLGRCIFLAAFLWGGGDFEERHNSLSGRRQQSAYIVVARMCLLCRAALPQNTVFREFCTGKTHAGRRGRLDETTKFVGAEKRYSADARVPSAASHFVFKMRFIDRYILKC